MGLLAARGDDFPRNLVKQFAAARGDTNLHTFGGQAFGNRAAYALARASHQRGFSIQLQIHREVPSGR